MFANSYQEFQRLYASIVLRCFWTHSATRVFMLFRRATFGIAFAVGRKAWKQRSGSGSSETNQFKGFENFVFFWKRMLLTCVNKILVPNGHGFSVV